jgi:hypothetical protein
LLPTNDGGATFTRLVDDGRQLKFASVPNAAEPNKAVRDARERHVKDQPVD